MRLSFLLLPALSLLCGCALITTGRRQSVAIETDPAMTAECTVSNRKGVWMVAATPASAKVLKARGPLRVTCATRDGAQGEISVASGMALATAGNAVIGGPVGSIVDMASGAAFRYPDTVTVPMAGGPDPRRKETPPGDLLPTVPDALPGS
jgi:hypothetical protein